MEKKVKNLGGRPRIEISEEQWIQIVDLAMNGSTNTAIASQLGICTDTITHRLQELGYSGFSEFALEKRQIGKDNAISYSISLAKRLAEDGNVTLWIFILKSVYGLSDKPEQTQLVKEQATELEIQS